MHAEIVVNLPALLHNAVLVERHLDVYAREAYTETPDTTIYTVKNGGI